MFVSEQRLSFKIKVLKQKIISSSTFNGNVSGSVTKMFVVFADLKKKQKKKTTEEEERTAEEEEELEKQKVRGQVQLWPWKLS